MSQTDFSSLELHPGLLSNLESLGYESMTPIQAESLPLVLSGRDVIAQAKTGSGKTAAFGLGLLNTLDVKRFRVQALVLCPTRELADQVAKEIRRLARAIHNIKVLTLCGGVPIGPQIGSLEHGAHIIVGTPGRIEDHLRKGTLETKSLTILVLDEADRMLDMGFQDSLDAIVATLPAKRQTLLFSATYPPQIKKLSRRVMSRPEMVTVASRHDESSITQHYYRLEQGQSRMTTLRLLLMHFRPESCVVFCSRRQDSTEVAEFLAGNGFDAAALHGDLEQRDRDQTLVRFANRSVSVLAATDVAARGLDIDQLDAVVNFQPARDSDTHLHRIGRTGRAGSKGQALTLFNEAQAHKIERLGHELEQSIADEPLPPADVLDDPPFRAPMATLQIDGGRKQKVRPGDILGALTGSGGVQGTQVGKIDIFEHCAYVAVETSVAKDALSKLTSGKLKGRSFRVRRIRR